MVFQHLDLQQIGLPIIVSLCVAVVLYIVVYPYLSGEAKAEKRMTALQAAREAESTTPRSDARPSPTV